MKFSENWLREWVNPDISTDTLVAKLTMAGLEVDAVEPAAGTFSGVVVGEIVAVEKHPDAEKLSVCRVAGHPDGEQQVVCGAPNARLGIKIPFALIGAQLPGDFKIKKAKLRGVESFGMLCAQTELKLGEDDSGLWELPSDAPVGEDLVAWLGLSDQLIEVDLTPNRCDCLSIRGLAREVGVLTGATVAEAAVSSVDSAIDDLISVTLAAPEACPNYAGRIIRNVDLSRPTPIWLVEKLRRSGIRSIDPVVDTTNYVLLELGQPMHAFDLAKLDGGITVRFSELGESLALLNGQTVELRQNSLVIADNSGPLALAGVMGGEASAVGSSTQDIFLESAFFQPQAIAGVARSYGLHTDSSHRFERGVDFKLQKAAIERATQLILEIVGGQPGPIVLAEQSDQLPKRKPVKLRAEKLASALLIDVAKVDIVGMMSGLGLRVLESDAEAWLLEPPSYRFDIEIEEDLIEEVARIYGYDNLPSRPLTFESILPPKSERDTPLASLKSNLGVRGYQEVVTYSFVDPKIHQTLFGEQPAIGLKNPISADLAVMRTSLVPGLLTTLMHNLNRQQSRVKIFESGMVFQSAEDSIEQSNCIAGLLFGSVTSPNWGEKHRQADFYDLKGDLEALLQSAVRGRAVGFAAAECPEFLHPGQSAQVLIDGANVGWLGALHPSMTKAIGIKDTVWLFECQLSELLSKPLAEFKPLSKFPEVARDIAIVVDKEVCVADIDKAIRKVADSVLKELKLFDVYSGEGIDPKRKSLAFSLTFQASDRTMVDDEVNNLMNRIVTGLESDYGADLR